MSAILLPIKTALGHNTISTQFTLVISILCNHVKACTGFMVEFIGFYWVINKQGLKPVQKVKQQHSEEVLCWGATMRAFPL